MPSAGQRQERTCSLADPNAEDFTSTKTTHRHGNAVFEERAPNAVEVERPFAAPAELEQAAVAAGRRSADRPGGEQVARPDVAAVRSEEHTSELQSRGHLVCRLLLEKKNSDIRP